MNDADRLIAALERLLSNAPAIVEALRQAGYSSLALQVKRDIGVLVKVRDEDDENS